MISIVPIQKVRDENKDFGREVDRREPVSPGQNEEDVECALSENIDLEHGTG